MLLVITKNKTSTEDIMRKLIAKLEDIMVAVTFAESGEYEEAKKHSSTSLSAQEEPLELGKTAVGDTGK